MDRTGALGRARRNLRGLTDDALTHAAPSGGVRAYLADSVDRLAGADPGLNQLRTATQAVLGILLAVIGVDVLVSRTGALQISTGPPAVVSAQHHAVLIVSMLLAGMLAMMAGFTVNDATARGQLLTTLWLPVPMLVAIASGLLIGRHRVPSLIFLVLLMAGAVYVRRWGPRGFTAGLVAFNGGFLGFFLHAELALRDIGWLAADLGIGVLASLIVRFAILRPHPARTLLRMRRSWRARAHRLLLLSAAALDADASDRRACARIEEQLRRQVVRFNESTLMIDAQLVHSDPQRSDVLAQELFEADLALSNCARFAAALAGAVECETQVRRAGKAALTALAHRTWPQARSAAGELERYDGPVERMRVLAHRLGVSVRDYADAGERLDSSPAGDPPRADPGSRVYVPAVELNNGYLPGSLPVSTAASTTVGRGGRLDHTALPPYLRATIQAGVAATLAVVVGDLVSGPRLYWAVLAAFLAFMATTNSGEQVRKALFRAAGSAVGIVLGDLLVRLTGGQVWSSIVIVLVALFIGIYLIRINYTFMVIGVTVTMSLLYKQLGEFSWNLLVLRLGETVIGVGAVVVTVLVIVPLRPQRVLTAGVLLWFQALSDLLDQVLDHLVAGRTDSLRPAVRVLDANYAALDAAILPLRHGTFGRNSAQLTEIRSLSAAARNYARSLAATVEHQPGRVVDGLDAAAAQLRASSRAIAERIESGTHGRYIRSAALVDAALQAQPPGPGPIRALLRDLGMLDGALARLAAALGMDVLDHDTRPDTAPELTPATAAAHGVRSAPPPTGRVPAGAGDTGEGAP